MDGLKTNNSNFQGKNLIIEESVFDGEKVIRLINGDVEMMVTLNIGPRISYFGKVDGKNILYWDKEGVAYKEWKLYGGHRVWLTRPMADETEDTYQPDNEQCDIELLADGIIIKSQPTKGNIVRGMKISLKEDGSYDVTGFVENQGPMLYSAGVWAPTCIDPRGKIIGVSIGDDKSLWDAVRLVIPRKFAGMECKVNDDQVTFSEKFMIVEPKGKVCKRCIYSAKGLIAMNWPQEELCFVKTVKVIRDGNYQMGGCNMAVFVGANNFMAEMETYGEEKTIYPGEQITHTENWTLLNQLIDFN